MSFVPEYSFPSSISPAPNPVPNVRNTIFLAPLPAPNRHSASAHAFASFCKNAGTPKRPETAPTIGTSSQPGRFGGDRIRPRAASSGPPQLIPTASGRCSGSASNSAPSTSLQPAHSRVRISRRNSTFPASSPETSAHFVPPMSIPQTYLRMKSLRLRPRGFIINPRIREVNNGERCAR